MEYSLHPHDKGRLIYFDMDGTLADLYGVPNMSQRLDSFDVSPYLEAKPIPQYVQMLKDAKEMGYRIGILTAGSRMPSSVPQPMQQQMNEATIEAKIAWLRQNDLLGYIDVFQFVPTGVDKYESALDKTSVLVDDDDSVLSTWYSGRIKAIGPSKPKF